MTQLRLILLSICAQMKTLCSCLCINLEQQSQVWCAFPVLAHIFTCARGGTLIFSRKLLQHPLSYLDRTNLNLFIFLNITSRNATGQAFSIQGVALFTDLGAFPVVDAPFHPDFITASKIKIEWTIFMRGRFENRPKNEIFCWFSVTQLTQQKLFWLNVNHF